MDLKQINKQIARENACYIDLLLEAGVYLERKDFYMAQEALRDAMKSLVALEELEKRKQLHTMPYYLKKIGVISKVVKRYANQR